MTLALPAALMEHIVGRVRAQERFTGSDMTHHWHGIAVMPDGERWRVIVAREGASSSTKE